MALEKLFDALRKIGEKTPVETAGKAKKEELSLPKLESNTPQLEPDWNRQLGQLQILQISILKEWQEAMNQVKNARVCGLDLETTSLDPLKGRIRLIQIAIPEGKVFVVDCLAVPEAVELLSSLLADPEVMIVGHNLKFDLSFIRAALGRRPPVENLFDTMLAAQLAEAGFYRVEKSEQATKHLLKEVHPSYALGNLAERYLGVILDKSFQKSDWSGELSQEQLRYAAQDAAVVLSLASILKELLERNYLEKAAKLEFECLPSVVEIELSGMPFNAEEAKELLIERERTKEEVRQRLISQVEEIGFIPREKKSQKGAAQFNPQSNVDILDCLNFLGFEVKDTREETLQELTGKGCSLAGELLQYRGLAKEVNFLEDWLSKQHVADGRIHASYYQLNPNMTGRFSCSNPNLQQIPKKEELRELFKAPEGRVFIAADFSGIELRIMAWLSQDERMMQAFQEGIDLHRLTASAVTGKEISEVTNEERQAAKAINFALIYGGSAKTLRNYARVIYGVEMSIEEAERAVKTFFANYLQVAEWHKIRGGKRFNPETHWFYESGKGFLTKSLVGTRTASGRKRIWPYYAGETRATTMQLFNTPCQGTGADIVKKAMIDFYRALLERNWNNVYLVGTVHDELLVEVPQELVHEVTSLLIQKMEAAGEDFIWPVPVKVEVK